MTTFDPPRPWVASYAEGVPEDLGPVDGSLIDIVAASARDYPDAVALQFFVFLLSAVVAAALGGGGAGAFDGAGQELWDGLAACLLSTMFGVGLAAAIRRTALAIVAVILVSLVGNGLILALLPDASGYLSTITAVGALVGGPEAPTALEVISSLTLWYVLPLGIGWWITEKSEA